MQRSNFDVASIAALLRQTEANLSALKPREEPLLSQPKPAWNASPHHGASTPQAGSLDYLLGGHAGGPPPQTVPAAAPQPAGIGAVGSGSFPLARSGQFSGEGYELEAQVMQLRGGLERLERRLEEELRAFLGVCDKRMQAKEEYLRSVGDALQASANGVAESLSQRVDARIRDLERVAHEKGDKNLEEIWDSLRRVQADGRAFEGRLQRCAVADDFADRLREAERSFQQRIDERLSAHERRAVEHRSQLESGSEAWRESVNQRCHALETRVWEQQADRGDLAEVILKRLPESATWRELQEEVRAQVYAVEVQQRRLASCEAKLSKLPALEAKVEFAESQTAQQIEEQAQTARGLGDVAQRLSQKLLATETACQRVEAQGASLEARFRVQADEDRERVAADIEAMQQRAIQRMDEVDARLQRSISRSEREVGQQIAALMQRTNADVAASRSHMDALLRELEPRTDAVASALRQDIERVLVDLRGESRKNSEALEVLQTRLAEIDTSASHTKSALEDLRGSVSSAEGHFKARVLEITNSVFDGVRSTVSGLEERQKTRVLESANETETVRGHIDNLKSRLADLETGSVRSISMVEGLRTSVYGFEEQLKARVLEWSSESEVMKGRVESFQTRFVESQVGIVRAQTSIDTLKGAVAGLESLKGAVAGMKGAAGSPRSSTGDLPPSPGRRTHELVAESEAKILSHFSSLSGELRSELKDWMTTGVGGKQSDDSAAASDAYGSKLKEPLSPVAQSRWQVLQDAVGELRSELAALRNDVSGNAAQLKDWMATGVSGKQLDESAAASDPSSRVEEAAATAVARSQVLQDAVGELRSELAALRIDVSSHATRKDQLAAQILGIQEDTVVLKNRVGECSTSVGEHSVKIACLREDAGVLQESTKTNSMHIGECRATLKSVEESLIALKAARSAQAMLVSQPDAVDIEEPLTLLEARLSRIENQVHSTEVEGSRLVDHSAMSAFALQPATRHSQAPAQDPFIVLKLSWSGEPRLPVQSPESSFNFGHELAETRDAQTGLASALCGAVAARLAEAHPGAANLNVIYADVRQDRGGGGPCSATYWLAAADAPIAEAELQRQLDDPNSALRLMFPGLILEDSSAMVQQPTGMMVVPSAEEQSMRSRVDDLEHSRYLLAESLGEVERRMHHVEKLAAGGALGLQLGGALADPLAGDVSEFPDVAQDASGEMEERLASPKATRRRDNGTSTETDGEESVPDLAFETGSPDGEARGGPSPHQLWEADEAAAKAARERRQRLREEAAAAQEAAERAAAEEAAAAQAALEEERRIAKTDRCAESWDCFAAGVVDLEEARQRRERRLQMETLRAELHRREAKAFDCWVRLSEGILEMDQEAVAERELEAHFKSKEEEQTRRAAQATPASASAANSKQPSPTKEQAPKGHEATLQRCVEVAMATELSRSIGRDVAKGLPLTARANKYSKQPEVQAAFEAAGASSKGILDHEAVQRFLGGGLGFGQAEIENWWNKFSVEAENGERSMSFEFFQSGYAELNPFMITKREGETIIRKHGSLAHKDLSLGDLYNCEAYICDHTAQIFVDMCHQSTLLIGPCDSAVFVRDCEDCTLWIAAQQLRTRNCKRCKFYLYSKTEPIIESSEELLFAPWSAAYPHCTAQFSRAGFDPLQNRWNCVFDFTGSLERSNWQILPLSDVEVLTVELKELVGESAAPDNPVPTVTHEILCADPLEPDENCGESLGGSPQTRPSLPLAPAAGVTPAQRAVKDAVATASCRAAAVTQPDLPATPTQGAKVTSPAQAVPTTAADPGLPDLGLDDEDYSEDEANSFDAAESGDEAAGARDFAQAEGAPDAASDAGLPDLGSISHESAPVSLGGLESPSADSVTRPPNPLTAPGPAPAPAAPAVAPAPAPAPAPDAGQAPASAPAGASPTSDAGLPDLGSDDESDAVSRANSSPQRSPAARAAAAAAAAAPRTSRAADTLGQQEQPQQPQQQHPPKQEPAVEKLPTPRVQGTMAGGDDSDGDSSDGAPPPLGDILAAAEVAGAPDPSDDSGSALVAAPSVSAPTVPAVNRRSLVGESSSEEGDGSDAGLSPSAGRGVSAMTSPAPKTSPLAGSLSLSGTGNAGRGLRLAKGGDSDDESDEAEKAISSWSAPAPKRSPNGGGQPTAGRGLNTSGSKGLGLSMSSTSGMHEGADDLVAQDISALSWNATPTPVKAPPANAVGIGGAAATQQAQDQPVGIGGAPHARSNVLADLGLDETGNQSKDAGNSWDSSIGSEAARAIGVASPTHSPTAAEQSTPTALGQAQDAAGTGGAQHAEPVDAAAHTSPSKGSAQLSGTLGSDDDQFDDNSEIDLP